MSSDHRSGEAQDILVCVHGRTEFEACNEGGCSRHRRESAEDRLDELARNRAYARGWKDALDAVRQKLQGLEPRIVAVESSSNGEKP